MRQNAGIIDFQFTFFLIFKFQLLLMQTIKRSLKIALLFFLYVLFPTEKGILTGVIANHKNTFLSAGIILNLFIKAKTVFSQVNLSCTNAKILLTNQNFIFLTLKQDNRSICSDDLTFSLSTIIIT